jgi:hypothetical protein
MTLTEWNDIEIEAGGRFKTEITVISYDKTSEAEVFVSIVDDWSNA